MDYNVLIIGGGIQGVGILHDLATRGVTGVHLLEKNILASGTSSRSTKLVHGGLRYLEHFAQWGLVREALHERTLLLRLLKGIVTPLPFVLPNFKTGRPPWMVRTGLFLYDSFAGDTTLPRAKKLSKAEILERAPYLKKERVESEMRSAFLFYDAQMLDDVIVRLSARAATKLGATYSEHSSVTHVEQRAEGGFLVTFQDAQGNVHSVTAKKVVNAGGAWCNANLLKWGYVPKIKCLLNVGSHLVFSQQAVKADPKSCAASLLQNDDGRVIFFIPWNEKWLLGTTESILEGRPENLRCPPADKEYLLKAARSNLDINVTDDTLMECFSGIRTMPISERHSSERPRELPGDWQNDPFSSPYYITHLDKNISSMSRESVVNETVPGLVSIYGGKYTTYRAQAEKVSNRLCKQLGIQGESGTDKVENWFLDHLDPEERQIFESPAAIRQL